MNVDLFWVYKKFSPPLSENRSVKSLKSKSYIIVFKTQDFVIKLNLFKKYKLNKYTIGQLRNLIQYFTENI